MILWSIIDWIKPRIRVILTLDSFKEFLMNKLGILTRIAIDLMQI